MGLVYPLQFWLTLFEENRDLPGGPNDQSESYRKAVWQVISLFRDGKTPGTINVNTLATNPPVQLVAVQSFMNRIEFALASPEVQAAFEQWKEMLESLSGRGFPSGLPQPDQMAQMQQQGVSLPAGGGF